jgi:hypothetical protein
MERTHTPLSVWFWAAYLAASHTAGLTRYDTAFGILHKLRAAMGENRISMEHCFRILWRKTCRMDWL